MSSQEFLMDIFGAYGDVGAVAMVFVAFLLDATLIPFIPEIFIIIGFNVNPTPTFAIVLISIAIIAEWAGNLILYCIVRKIGVPERLKSIVYKYIDFLIVSDERALLINRIAPMIPYSGIFIGIIDKWKLWKCLMYLTLGCVLKYGLILSLNVFFYNYFNDANLTLLVMIVFVFIIIGISFVASYYRKKKTFSTE